MIESIFQGILITGCVGGFGVIIENYFLLRPKVRELGDQVVGLRNNYHDMRQNNVVQFDRYTQANSDVIQRLEDVKKELRGEFSTEIKEINEKFDRIEEKMDSGFTGLGSQMTSLVSAILSMKGHP